MRGRVRGIQPGIFTRPCRFIAPTEPAPSLFSTAKIEIYFPQARPILLSNFSSSHSFRDTIDLRRAYLAASPPSPTVPPKSAPRVAVIIPCKFLSRRKLAGIPKLSTSAARLTYAVSPRLYTRRPEVGRGTCVLLHALTFSTKIFLSVVVDAICASAETRFNEMTLFEQKSLFRFNRARNKTGFYDNPKDGMWRTALLL